MADLELQSDACSAVSAFPLVGVDMHVCIISTSTEKKRIEGVVDISLILCDAGDTFRASQQEARHPFPGLVPPCLLKPCHELKKSESEKQTEKKKKRVKKILVLKDMFTSHSQKLQLYLFCRSEKFWLLLVREICKRCEESPRGIKTYRVRIIFWFIFL